MKVLYISNVISEELNNSVGASVAGNIYSLSLCKEFNRHLGNDNFDIISLSGLNLESLNEKYIWDNKPLFHIIRGNYPILGDIVQGFRFTSFLKKWCRKNKDDKKIIVVNNSPAQITLPLLLYKKKFKLNNFSITIDTPFTKDNKFKGLIGRLTKLYFKIGHYTLRYFDGIAIFHEKALNELKIKIPFIITAIGYNDIYLINQIKTSDTKIKIAFSGTLIYYNGIVEIIETFKVLDPEKYELHIYGYGPLENYIKENVKSNIIFHGRYKNSDIINELKKMDVLLNIRLIDQSIQHFTFPSKLIEYIMLEKPIITSNFATLPYEYKDFLFVLDDINALSIKAQIENIQKMNIEAITSRLEKAAEYIKINNSYEKITEKLLTFFDKNRGNR